MEAVKRKEATRSRLREHLLRYPACEATDVFKYLFHSSFGCEHLVKDCQAALEYIKKEHKDMTKGASPLVERLDGEYSRISLSCIDEGLKPETLAKMFLLSAKKEPCGREKLEEKLSVATEMVACGELPFDKDEFDRELSSWREAGYPAVHHSDTFKAEYKPSYRVVANRFADVLELFIRIDKMTENAPLTVAVEGGSASGKTTLSSVLSEVYDVAVFHMDDFFLRPEQRTAERLSEIGGNVDRERFIGEVLCSLRKGEAVCYRPFDCGEMALGDSVTVEPCRLNVVEGVYSMHPEFKDYYGLAVFLDIDKEYQRARVLRRNGESLAKRFFSEWIPREDAYFSAFSVKKRCDIVISVKEK